MDKQNYIVDNEDGGEDDEEQTGDDILNGLSNENEGEEKLENLKESLNKVEETHPENWSKWYNQMTFEHTTTLNTWCDKIMF